MKIVKNDENHEKLIFFDTFDKIITFPVIKIHLDRYDYDNSDGIYVYHQ